MPKTIFNKKLTKRIITANVPEDFTDRAIEINRDFTSRSECLRYVLIEAPRYFKHVTNNCDFSIETFNLSYDQLRIAESMIGLAIPGSRHWVKRRGHKLELVSRIVSSRSQAISILLTNWLLEEEERAAGRHDETIDQLIAMSDEENETEFIESEADRNQLSANELLQLGKKKKKQLTA